MTELTASDGSHAPRGARTLWQGVRAVTLTSATLLSARNVGRHYVRPAIPAPVTWTPVTTESTPSQPKPPDLTTWPDAQWWHGFGSPDLDRLMNQAQQANDALQAAVARVQQSDAQVRIAGAPLLPSLEAGFTPARQRMILPNGTNQAISITTFTAQLSAAYELDFWGRNAALRAAAVAQDFGSRYDRQTVQLSLMASVASTYFTALSLRDRVEVATNNLANERNTLSGLQFEQRVGTATALDVAQQQSLED